MMLSNKNVILFILLFITLSFYFVIDSFVYNKLLAKIAFDNKEKRIMAIGYLYKMATDSQVQKYHDDINDAFRDQPFNMGQSPFNCIGVPKSAFVRQGRERRSADRRLAAAAGPLRQRAEGPGHRASS